MSTSVVNTVVSGVCDRLQSCTGTTLTVFFDLRSLPAFWKRYIVHAAHTVTHRLSQPANVNDSHYSTSRVVGLTGGFRVQSLKLKADIPSPL